jgi:hypothetical protein
VARKRLGDDAPDLPDDVETISFYVRRLRSRHPSELRQRLRWIAEREVGLRWRVIAHLGDALTKWGLLTGEELAKWLR